MECLIIAGDQFRDPKGHQYEITRVFWSKYRRSSLTYLMPNGNEVRKTMNEFTAALDAGKIKLI